MKHLFTIDKKNYPPQGTVGRRPSVRGIIQRNGKLAMIHSLKCDYYKFPGGGMEEGESLEAAHQGRMARALRDVRRKCRASIRRYPLSTTQAAR